MKKTQFEFEKAVMKKITPAVGEILEMWKDRKGVSFREVAEKIGQPSSKSRFSEYRDFEHYKRPITTKIFVGLLKGEFMTIKDVIDRTPSLTDEEKNYLEDMHFYEDTKIRRFLINAQRKGVSIVDLAKIASECGDMGIDLVEIGKKEIKKRSD